MRTYRAAELQRIVTALPPAPYAWEVVELVGGTLLLGSRKTSRFEANIPVNPECDMVAGRTFMARDNPEEPLVVEPKARMHSAVKAIFDAAWGETGKPQHVRTGIPILRMLVQMIDDQRIRVELFPISSTAAAFTNNARDFKR